ncbi:MAG: ATP-binding protein [Candidatus Binatia bacterium]
MVRQILAAHGGSISYKSQLGKGTTFTVRLPAGLMT